MIKWNSIEKVILTYFLNESIEISNFIPYVSVSIKEISIEVSNPIQCPKDGQFKIEVNNII
jgi:hypothetical protein